MPTSAPQIQHGRHAAWCRRPGVLAMAVLLGTALLGAALTAAEPAGPNTPPIPQEGLSLWLSADGAVIDHGEVIAIKDRSGRGNDAIRQTDPDLVAGNPVVVKQDGSGVPVLRFNGGFCGYSFKPMTDIRTVFLVVAKHPDAFKKDIERFLISGTTQHETDFHVGIEQTDVLLRDGGSKGWFNGFECDPTVSEFSPQLAVIALASKGDRRASQLVRDRTDWRYKNRSWFGDIGDIILYTRALSDEERQQVEAHLLRKYAITPFPPVVVPRETVRPGYQRPPETGSATRPR